MEVLEQISQELTAGSDNDECEVKVNSARNNSWPLAIFQPISTFGRPKSVLVDQIYCTFSMGRPSITYKMSHLQKNSQPISDSYFYHWININKE